MMTKPDLPDNKQPVHDEQGRKRCDVGRKVLVNTVAGAIVNQEGVVVEGPYWWVIEGVVKAKVQKGKEPKDKYVPKTWDSVPYWVVQMKANGFYHRLAENELTFVR